MKKEEKKKHVGILGSGGREHALAWAIAGSPQKPEVTCIPGNAGTLKLGKNADVDLDELDEIVEFCKSCEIDFVVVGPEALLFEGVADKLRAANIPVFGPSAKSAVLESSKIFAKNFCRKHGIPTADYVVFERPDAAHRYIDKSGQETFVVKADGPAAGKGAFVCDDPIDAHAAVDTCMIDKKFGDSGKRIIIEERLTGFETTLMALVADGRAVKLPYSQDHKRAYDNDKGPNTGGMGVFAPTPKIDSALDYEITQQIVNPTLQGLMKDKIPYQGCLYFGIMVTDNGPYLIEYNCRFGDPEAQAVLPLISGDFLQALVATANNDISGIDLNFTNKKALCVILASKGYPESYRKGLDITKDLNALEKSKDLIIFHAGTTKDGKRVLTSGGRVIAVTAVDDAFTTCRKKVYDAIQAQKFEGLFYRKDIGRELENI